MNQEEVFRKLLSEAGYEVPRHRNAEHEDEMLDGIIKMLENFDVNCLHCKHLHEDEISCAAFPDVIPDPIITGEIRHTEKMFSQKNDIVFEKE